ncbi:mucin-17 [Calliphora vicina]|uniref:mucin-17 n=1 Tax=Calliphora vicina TaxID=7373 RepID=UPI00325AF7C5
MSEDKVYRDGDIVWVKLGNNWWPGEVTGSNRHPEGLIKHLKRVPYCVVKFFNESTYEYVRSSKQIFPFQCAKKEEFIRKGYSLYNSGNSFMEKFPNDVEMAKRLTHPKESSLIINDRPDSIVKAILGQPLIRTCDDYYDGTEYREKRRSGDSITKILNITQNRNDESLNNDKHGSQTSTTSKLPNNKTKNVANTTGSTNMSNYQCNMCDFTSVRQNVMILHRKMHSNRNSLGSINTSSSSSTTTNAKSTPATVGTAVATTTNTNQSKQNEIVNKNKTISKTKVNTNTTTVTGTTRTTRTSIPVKETNTRATPAPETNAAAIDAVETAITPLTPKDKNNRISKTQTPTSQGKTNKSKTGKKTVVKEKKEASAYATILSDFCTSDSETSPSAEEKQSRRSLRHCKNLNENTTGKVSTMVCIDLSETKIIQKIPKKREYSSLQLQEESLPEKTTPVVVADPDVVCLADKETETATTTPSTAHSANSKRDAEDIRRMLLADWSDDDETPNDAIVVEDSVILENAESNECISETVNEQDNATAVVLTSTPVVTSTPASTGRIRNIPKKDRRDVVLQDFNSDLSVIQADKVEHSNKCMAVDLDSSNSSVVEIIEDEQSATIITINDDEEQQDISKSQKNPTDIIVTESKDNDSAVGLVNDKSASAATSTTTLSCFDFQEDEDEQETTNTTISHFKKKYLSVEKLQSISSNTDELREDIVAKSRAELAEKDQRLTAEIESLLEQTQPPVADLLNTSSFEESISVKDLPIKERGKRIFKSRNKTRTEEKTNGDVMSTTTVDAGATTEQNKSMETPTTVEEIVNNDQDKNESNMQQTSLTTAAATTEQYNSDETPTILEEIVNNDNDKNEGNLQQESEITTDKELILIPDQDNLSNNNCLVENSIQEAQTLNSSNAELPKYLEEKQLTPNENKENQDLTGGNKDSSEVSNGDYNTSEIQKEQMDKEKASDNTDANTNNEEESTQNMPIEQEDNVDNDDSYTSQPLNDQEVTAEQQEVKQVAEQEVKQDDLVEDGNENCADVEKFKEIEFDTDDNKKPPKTPESAVAETADKEINDIPVNNVIISENQTSKLSKTELEADLKEESFRETEIPQSTEENINDEIDNDKQLKITMTETKDDIDKNFNQQQSSENVFKIRVKSPDQLFDHAFAIDSNHEQELQPNIDGNGDTRLITTTPTDENSSMGASDTGAEFGSPTSMLSDERLPTFRFQGNQTPQQEITDTPETESQEENSQETVHEETVAIVGKTEPNGEIKENMFKGIPEIFVKSNQKLLHQRRFSMDSDVLQTEPKSFKRQRLSVDDTTTNLQNNLGKSQEVLMPFTSPLDKSGGRIRPKSRHVKITPRRNVSELFKTRLSIDNQASKVIEKSISLESVKETQQVEEVVGTDLENDLENHKEDTIVAENNENSKGDSNSSFEKSSEAKQHQVEDNCMASLDNPEQSEESSEHNDLEETTDKEDFNKIPEAEEDKQECSRDEELKSKTTPEEITADGENMEESNVKETHNMAAMEVETETTADKDNTSAITNSPTYVTTTEISMPEVAATNPDENELESSIFADEELDTAATENTPSPTTNNIESNLENNEMMEADQTPNVDAVETAETPTIIVNSIENVDNYVSTSSIKHSLDTSKTHNEQGLENPFSPGVPPPTPQESEVVIESENLSQLLNTQQQTKTIVESETEITIRPLTPKGNRNTDELIMPVLIPQEKEPVLDEVIVRPETPKEDEPLNDMISCPLTPQETEHINEAPSRPITPKSEVSTNKCETLTKPATPQPQVQDMTVELENNISMPCTPQDNFIDEVYENPMQTPATPQAKDLIIECEPSTPQGIIECDHNIPAQVTPEKEVIIESDVVLATPPSVSQEKDIIIEETLQMEEKDTLLEKEFQVIQPKEMPNQPNAAQTNTLQTDADKAAEEFLIEFDSIVNHSHSVEEDVPNSSVEDGINAEDLINNIIEEVHEDQQIKQDVPTVTESPLQFEPLATYTVVAAKNSWNQIFKESFHRQLPPAKRRQTICFEISDTKEGVACKKQALDFESILPVSKTVKRTAERKLTLPAIETKLSNSHRNQNILALNHNPLTLNRKLIPTTKRKLSIEDNITSFIIERPKQQQPPASTAGGPPPLQRIRPLSRQDHSRASIDSFSEPPPLQSHDNLYHELFQAESTSPTPSIELPQKTDGARVIHQQILNPPAISSIPHTRTSDSKISKNKQIGVDSRGNKYVIIKTPPTNIIVQPSLTSSTSAAVTATNNFGTTITIQPIPLSTSEVTITKATTKTKNVSASAPSSSRKQQQQHMKQISITVPAKSPLQISKPLEVAAKTPPRNRRKAAHAKAVAAAATANSNINSAKHRQAMEALSRRLSIATEAPPLAKLSRTPTTHVQTQISNNSNLTFFADTQLSNIAQQQLMQLQQQQQQQQQQAATQTSSLPPPIILNKNAHQHSVIPRKPRKTLLQQQQLQQQQQQAADAAAKSSQLLQQLQQQQQNQLQQQQQHQQIQQHFITQIAAQPQQTQQQHNLLQPPPLQQIQQQTVPVQQHQQQIIQQSDGIIITTTATEDDNVIDSNTQLIALPTQPYPGYAETFLLCKVKGNTCKPVDNVPLYLNHQLNELVPVPLEALEGGHKPQEHQIEIKATNVPQQMLVGQSNSLQNNEGNLQITNLNCNLIEGEMSSGIEAEHQYNQHNQQQQLMEECAVDENASNNQIRDFGDTQDVNSELIPNNGILLNIEGQQVLLDAATFAHLLANPDANTQLISDDGTEYVLTHEVLAALQMQQEQQQALELSNASAAAQQQQQHQNMEQAGANDILAAALAGSELYDSEVLSIDTSQAMQIIDGDGSIVFPAQSGAINQQHLTPPAVVTNAVLDQSPIMSALEVPSSIATQHKLHGTQLITVPSSHHLATSTNAALGVGRSNLEDSLAAIGVTTSSCMSSSLGLPITVTNPNIASKVTSAGPLNEMLQFVSHRPATAAATAAAVAAAALAGESRIFTD